MVIASQVIRGRIEEVTLKYARAIGTTNITTSSTSFVDMADMSLTVTVEDNPILIIAQIPISGVMPTGEAGIVRLLIDGAQKAIQETSEGSTSTPPRMGNLAWLEVLSAGEYTIKLQWRVTNAVITLRQPGASYPRMLMAIELVGAEAL